MGLRNCVIIGMGAMQSRVLAVWEVSLGGHGDFMGAIVRGMGLVT